MRQDPLERARHRKDLTFAADMAAGLTVCAQPCRGNRHHNEIGWHVWIHITRMLPPSGNGHALTGIHHDGCVIDLIMQASATKIERNLDLVMCLHRYLAVRPAAHDPTKTTCCEQCSLRSRSLGRSRCVELHHSSDDVSLGPSGTKREEMRNNKWRSITTPSG